MTNRIESSRTIGLGQVFDKRIKEFAAADFWETACKVAATVLQVFDLHWVFLKYAEHYANQKKKMFENVTDGINKDLSRNSRVFLNGFEYSIEQYEAETGKKFVPSEFSTEDLRDVNIFGLAQKIFKDLKARQLSDVQIYGLLSGAFQGIEASPAYALVDSEAYKELNAKNSKDELVTIPSFEASRTYCICVNQAGSTVNTDVRIFALIKGGEQDAEALSENLTISLNARTGVMTATQKP